MLSYVDSLESINDSAFIASADSRSASTRSESPPPSSPLTEWANTSRDRAFARLVNSYFLKINDDYLSTGSGELYSLENDGVEADFGRYLRTARKFGLIPETWGATEFEAIHELVEAELGADSIDRVEKDTLRNFGKEEVVTLRTLYKNIVKKLEVGADDFFFAESSS